MSEPYICPRCHQGNTRLRTKKESLALKGGLPILSVEKAEEVTYEEVECLNCGNLFSPEEAEPALDEEDEEVEEDEEETEEVEGEENNVES